MRFSKIVFWEFILEMHIHQYTIVGIHVRVFIPALFIIQKNWKHLKYSLIGVG